MSRIAHIRIDYRLIHGQVITKWLKQVNAKRIVIFDDMLRNNEFLASVYKMAAPEGIVVDIRNAEEAKEYIERNSESLFILFKTIKMAKAVIDYGAHFDEIQIGGLENKSGRKMVHNQISMDLPDAEILKEIEGKGTKVYFQTIPGESIETLDEIIRKLK